MGMTIYDLVKKYGKGKGETVMWDATRMMSDALKPMKETDPDHYWHLVKQMYALMNGPHFDEDFGRWQISQMHFTDKAGKQHHAPYWTDAQMQAVYEAHKSKLKQPSYTCWDFAVVLNMIKSDNWCLYRSWWPEATDADLDNKVFESAVNYLNDEDYPQKDGKIWHYFNG